MGFVWRGFGGLFTFSGRERRSVFWPFVGVVVVVSVFAEVLMTLPMLARVSTGYLPKVTGPVLGSTIINAASILCLAAAAARRLRDGGVSPYWGLIPIPFFMVQFVGFNVFTARFQDPGGPDIRLFMALFVNNLTTMATLVVLIILLCRPSSSDHDEKKITTSVSTDPA